jgi:hypothetical protein
MIPPGAELKAAGVWRMTPLNINWLLAMSLGVVGALTVIGFGVHLLRRVVEDFSNSTELPAYLLRAARSLPGVFLVLAGLVLLSRVFSALLKVSPI